MKSLQFHLARLVIGGAAVAAPAAVLAQRATLPPGAGSIPGAGTANDVPPLTNLRIPIIGGADGLGVVERLIGIIFLWGGIIAFFFVLYGGFIYLTSGGDAARAQTGQRTIINAVIGVILIAISYVIVQFVVSELRGLNR